VVLYLREATFNAVVIAGLVMAVAAVVDDATSGVERIARRLRDRTDEDRNGADAGAVISPSALVLGAALETARTLGFALAALVVALLPVFVLEGLAGDSFYPPLAISFLVAAVVSMLVAVTVTQPSRSRCCLGRQGAIRTPRSCRRCAVRTSACWPRSVARRSRRCLRAQR
jgi:multidrug efflux pump subunit AcrB